MDIGLFSHAAARRSVVAIALSITGLAACVPETGTPPASTTTTTIPVDPNCVDGPIGISGGSIYQVSKEGFTILRAFDDWGDTRLEWHDVDSGESGALGTAQGLTATMSADGSMFLRAEGWPSSSAHLTDRAGNTTVITAPDDFQVSRLASDDLSRILTARYAAFPDPTQLEVGILDRVTGTHTLIPTSAVATNDTIFAVDSTLSRFIVRRYTEPLNPWDWTTEVTYDVMNASTFEVERTFSTVADHSVIVGFADDDTIFLTGGRPPESEDEIGTAYWIETDSSPTVSKAPPELWATVAGANADGSRVLWQRPLGGFLLVTGGGTFEIPAFTEPPGPVIANTDLTRLLHENDAFDLVQVCLP